MGKNTIEDVYCFCCKLFGIKSCTNKIGNEGTKDWKNLGAKLKSHETSVEHISNMNSWIDLEMRLLNNKTIDKDMQEQISKEKEHWRHVLKRIIVVVKNLAKNNLAFRGTNEKIYQRSNGNFLSLIEMIAEFDPIMNEHLKCIQNSKIHNHYLGHNIQNELVQMLALEVKNTITKTFKEVKYFSIILDCTPDTSHQEQMSLIIRCVDISTSPINIKEFFLEFLKGYDNGFNMKGKHQGLQKRLLDINPLALYTPCGCHNLNLVLCDIATSSITFQASKIRDALLELAKVSEDPKIKSESECLAIYELENFEFLLGMIIWYDILFTINAVSKNLQHEDTHIEIAMDQLKGLISFFERYRENGFTNAMIVAKEIANELEIEPKFCEKCTIQSFRIEYFVYIIDQSLFSVRSRFEQFQMYKSIFGFLFNFKRLKALEEDVSKCCCLNLQDSLKNKEIYDIDGLNLFSELKVLREILQKENSNPIEILNYIKTKVDCFPNAYIALEFY
ncbi:hypothetical protein UlMin_014247 [Ulmus minor]